MCSGLLLKLKDITQYRLNIHNFHDYVLLEKQEKDAN